MKFLVTGAAGFIGSHLCERLVKEGHKVLGVDAFIPYYPRKFKERNLRHLKKLNNFSFKETDLRYDNLESLLEGVDVVVHEAAMAGLMKSWTEFDQYMSCNLLGTQRLLEAAKKVKLKKFIHASTSSVYGRNATGAETSATKPVSPYGITKLAAENLCLAYHKYFAIPIVILRYFSIFGPRQRPDMVYHIFIRDIVLGKKIYIYGDGEQTRTNTYISDCIDGTVQAIERGRLGEIYNIGGGEEISVNKLKEKIEEMLGKKAHLEYKPPRPGDQKRTVANFAKAKRDFSYQPKVGIDAGLKKQIQWQKTIYLGEDGLVVV